MGWMQPFLFWEFIQGAYLGLVPIPAFGLNAVTAPVLHPRSRYSYTCAR